MMCGVDVLRRRELWRWPNRVWTHKGRLLFSLVPAQESKFRQSEEKACCTVLEGLQEPEQL